MINNLFLNTFQHQTSKNVIYCFTNDVNGKKYVGLTINFKHRTKQHYVRGEKGHTHFYNAVRKYGWQHFHLSILEFVFDSKDLPNREVYWIANLDTFTPKGYNLTRGGDDNPMLNPEVTEKTSGSNNWNWKGGKVELECEQCGETFEVSYWKKDIGKFCSTKCHIAYTRKNPRINYIKITCEQCGETFEDYECNNRKFCCLKCYYKSKRKKI